jgi:hypothetical protein
MSNPAGASDCGVPGPDTGESEETERCPSAPVRIVFFVAPASATGASICLTGPTGRLVSGQREYPHGAAQTTNVPGTTARRHHGLVGSAYIDTRRNSLAELPSCFSRDNPVPAMTPEVNVSLLRAH